MGGIIKSKPVQQPVETVKEMAAPAAKAQSAAATTQSAAATTRESAEQKAATRRASRRGGMRGLLSQERLGGEQSTLGSVVQ